MDDLITSTMERLTDRDTGGLDGGGLRRLFYQLGYDWADDALPSLSAESPVSRWLSRPPRRIASAFEGHFSVLWFMTVAAASTPGQNADETPSFAWREWEKAIFAYGSARYPHALYLFSDPSGLWWRVACPSGKGDEAAAFSFGLSDLSRRVTNALGGLAVDDTPNDIGDGLLEHHHRCVAACQSAAERAALPASASVRDAKNAAIASASAKKEADEDDSGNGTALGSYLTRLTRTPLLSACDEAELLRRAKCGDEKARAHLIEANVRLVISIAKKHLWSGIALEDLVQEGVIGLIRAVEIFEIERGYRFATYATHWIRQTCGRAVENKSRVIRLPAHLYETIHQITKARDILAGYEETSAEFLAAYTELPLQKVHFVLKASQPVLSIDTDLGENQTASLMDYIISEETDAAPSARVFRRALKEEIKRAMTHLTPREREVLTLRYGLTEESEAPMTLEQVGKTLCLSRNRAYQIEAGALQKLRRGDVGGRLRETLVS